MSPDDSTEARIAQLAEDVQRIERTLDRLLSALDRLADTVRGQTRDAGAEVIMSQGVNATRKTIDQAREELAGDQTPS